MANKSDVLFVCKNCGNETSKWAGQCGYCGEWNSLTEVSSRLSVVSGRKKKGDRVGRPGGRVEPIKVSEVNRIRVERICTGIEELDRVFGSAGQNVGNKGEEIFSGIVPGSVSLLSGEPGMGKSTLLTQLALRLVTFQAKSLKRKAQSYRGVLYVCGEESVEQVGMRMERLEVVSKEIPHQVEISQDFKSVRDDKADMKSLSALSNNASMDGLFLLPETKVEAVVDEILAGKDKYHLVIVDSIQSMVSDVVPGFAGSVSQVRECGLQLTQAFKETGVAGILVGHVTKDGQIAGPRTLEHMVDTVLRLEGEQSHDLRLLRAMKNRFGTTDEVGVFRMTDKGLEEIKNAADVFLAESNSVKGEPGSVVTAILEGSRVMLLEVQALVLKSNLAVPRRVVNGVRLGRLQMILAVLQKQLGLRLGEMDVFVNVAGGVRIEEPAADLAIAAAVISSLKGKTVGGSRLMANQELTTERSTLRKADKVVCFGELGLLGEIRPVTGMERRLQTAKKLGYRQVIGVEEKSVSELARLI